MIRESRPCILVFADGKRIVVEEGHWWPREAEQIEVTWGDPAGPDGCVQSTIFRRDWGLTSKAIEQSRFEDVPVFVQEER